MKRVMKRLKVTIALMLVVVMSLAMTVFAEGEANEAAQAAKDAIFQVEVVYKDPATGSEYVLQYGTGFLIGSESNVGEYMITCDHVVRLTDEDLAWYKDNFGIDQGSQLDTSIQVVVKGSVTVGATIVNESNPDDMDFAILKLDQPISERKTLPLKTDGADETSDCYALGFPGLVTYMKDATVFTADDVTVTKGSVSNNIQNKGYRYIQHSATLAEGNSGGPLLDANGNVIGINTGSTWENANSFYYSLDVREVTEVLDYLNIVYTKADGSIAGKKDSTNSTTETTEASNNGDVDADKIALTDAVSNAQSKNADDYSAESYATLENAISKANTCLNNDASTADDYKAALDELKAAVDGLQPAETAVDKTALDSEIKAAEEYKEAEYDKDSFADLTQAISTAKEVNGKADATQAEVDDAFNALKTAEENLVEKSSNTTLFIIIGIIAFVVILIVVIIILVTRSNKKSQPSMNVNPMGGASAGGMSQGGFRDTPSPQSYPQIPSTPVAPEPRRPQPSPNAYPAPPTIPQVAEGAGETVLLNEGSGETTLLSETNQIMAVLVKTKTGEKITIGKREFKIGKERSKVDYCITNNSVSRVHAIITFENGEYYIKDNNSTNYTYLNGEAISGSQKMKLSNGDRIKFSDEEFQFKLA